jgi:hypothetical protein
MNKYIVGIHVMWSMYGFTRGYRSVSKYNLESKKEDVLMTTKILCGFGNGLMYSLPIWNIPMLITMVDRVEIEMRGYDKKKYTKSYEEWCGGVCYDTI